MSRGRPPRARAAVEVYLVEHAQDGSLPPIGQIVRACNLCDRSSAKRIIRDLRRLGRLSEFQPVSTSQRLA